MTQYRSVDRILNALVASQKDLTVHDLIEIEKHMLYIYTIGYEQGFRNGKEMIKRKTGGNLKPSRPLISKLRKNS